MNKRNSPNLPPITSLGSIQLRNRSSIKMYDDVIYAGRMGRNNTPFLPCTLNNSYSIWTSLQLESMAGKIGYGWLRYDINELECWICMSGKNAMNMNGIMLQIKKNSSKYWRIESIPSDNFTEKMSARDTAKESKSTYSSCLLIACFEISVTSNLVCTVHNLTRRREKEKRQTG